MGNSGRGKVWPQEWKRYQDPVTGVNICQLTDYKAHSHHLYFTEAGWYDEDRRLLFISDRENRTNLFSLHLETGEITQLTDLPASGMGAYLDPGGKKVYVRTGGQIIAVDLETLEEEVLYTQPAGFTVGRASCTADGRYIVASLTEDMSRLDPGHGSVSLRQRMEASPACKIIRFPAGGGEAEVLLEENSWIGHINPSTTQPQIITFCHEGPWNMVDHRIWGLDLESGEKWQIRPRLERHEYVGHEYWLADGIRVGYHGFRENGMAFFGAIRYDNTEMEEVEFEFVNWHAHTNDFSRVVVDGKFPLNNLAIWQRTGDAFCEARILCEHRSSFHSQTLHAHPRFSPDGKKLLFTSDRSGYGNLYMAEIPDDIEALPKETFVSRKENSMVRQ